MSRTIIIGDVHGCLDELEQLLNLVEHTGADRVYFVGDLVAKGPHGAGVVHLARQLNAVVVRGNHEARLLALRHATGTLNATHPLVATAKRLSPIDWAFIEATPLWHDLPEHQLRIVHAGVVPGRSIDAQDPNDLLTMRCLDANGRPDAKRAPDGQEHRRWAASYASATHVVFGHNALTEPQLHAHATGIDTGCVYGGRLTAVLLSETETVQVDTRKRRAQLRSVPARRVYVPIEGN